ncbi:MAG: integrase [Frankiales bacterium]|nr:integrase [Frankiales bacterium]
MYEVELIGRAEVAVQSQPTGPGPGFYAQAFLAGYSGRTRESYETTLKQWGTWCSSNDVQVLDVLRAHVQVFARELEQAGRAPATIAQKLSAIGGFYAYLVIEGVLPKSPVAHVRRPKVSDESTRFGLDAAELRQLLAGSNTHSREAHALVCLLALNGLRVSEACRARAHDLSDDRGHHLLEVLRKGGKRARVPLAPRTAAAVTALGRVDDELLIGLDRYGAWRLIKQLVDSAGIIKPISPHSLRHTFVTLALEAGVPLHVVQDGAGHADPRTTQRYNRGRKRLDNHATYALQTFLDA